MRNFGKRVSNVICHHLTTVRRSVQERQAPGRRGPARPEASHLRFPARLGVLRRSGHRADPARRARSDSTEEQLIHLINADLFTCGIASIIQSVGFWKVGVRLPLLQGVTFTAVAPMIAIGTGCGGAPIRPARRSTAQSSSPASSRSSSRPYFGKAAPLLPAGRHRHGDHHHRHRRCCRSRPTMRSASDTAPAPSRAELSTTRSVTLAIIVIIQRVFKGFMATIAVLARSGDRHAGRLDHPRRRELRRGQDQRLRSVSRPRSTSARRTFEFDRDRLDVHRHGHHRGGDHR